MSSELLMFVFFSLEYFCFVLFCFFFFLGKKVRVIKKNKCEIPNNVTVLIISYHYLKNTTNFLLDYPLTKVCQGMHGMYGSCYNIDA